MCYLLMFSVRLSVTSRLLVVKFWGSQKLYDDFLLQGGLSAPNLALFKGQLYILISCAVDWISLWPQNPYAET